MLNYTQRPEYEAKRLAIVRRAQVLALHKFTWDHVATRVEGALRAAMRSGAARHSRSSGLGQASEV